VRPRRVAFCIDPDQCPPELFDEIVDTNLRLWGGRCNPIIPVQGGAVPPAYWRLLSFVDPDIVYTYVDLPAPLVARLDREICPLEIRPHPPHLGGAAPFYRPANLGTGFSEWLPWLPDVIRREPFSQRVRVLLSQAYGDWTARRFILRNLGLIGETVPLWLYLDHEQAMLMTTADTESTVLRGVSALGLRFLFAHELAAHFSDVDEPERPSNAYALVIGSDIWAALFAWNRIVHLAAHRRLLWHTMWVPPDLLRSPDFAAALSTFLIRHVLQDGSAPASLEIWYSDAVGSDAGARALVGPALQNVDCIPQFHFLAPGDYPPVEARGDRFDAFERASLFTRFRPETFQLQAPARTFLVHIPETAAPRPVGGQRAAAMLDVKIEHVPDPSAARGIRWWWRLPKVLGITRPFGPPGRITTEGIPSFALGDEAAIQLTVPEPLGILYHLLVGHRHSSYRGDPRPAVAAPFYRCSPSDKGQYSRGIGALFGGLENAGRFYQHHFWRDILEWVSGRSREDDPRPVRAIADRLQTIQPVLERAAADDAAGREDLARFVLNVASGQRIRDRDLTFPDFRDRMAKEFKAYADAHPDRRAPTSDTKDLLDSLQALTTAEVFFQGTRIQCWRCLSTFWYAAEELDQHVRCQGCRTLIPLPVQVVWSYRLNALVRDGIASYGAGPVLSAITDLGSNAHSCFLVDPGVLLFERDNPNPVHDLDLVAIIDGRIVIGEVKSRAATFTDGRLRSLAATAVRIGAHVVVLAAFSDEGAVLGQHSATLRALIGDPTVLVEPLLPHPQTIEPRPLLAW